MLTKVDSRGGYTSQIREKLGNEVYLVEMKNGL